MPTFQITMQRGPRAGEVVYLDKPTVVIGREATTDVIINDPEVSRNHCRLILQGTYLIQDLGSTNGTFVDGRRLKGDSVRLRHGQQIQLGSNVILVYKEVEDEGGAVAAEGGTALGLASTDELEEILEDSELSEIEEAPPPLAPQPDVVETGESFPAGQPDRRRTYLIAGGVLILLVCCAVFGIWLGYFLTTSGLLPGS